MKKNTALFVLLLFAVSQGAFAQRTIIGKVTNSEDGLGMPGVSVVVKGTTTGMATDAVGNFSLIVPNNSAIIVVSFMGFKSVEILVGTQTWFDITLMPDAQVLGDVIVEARRIPPPEKVEIGLGIQRDPKTLTTSIQSISGDELRRAGDSNFLSALNGKIAGVEIKKANSGPGGSTLITAIRGEKSFSLPSNVLIVLDGVPMTNKRVGDPRFDTGDGLSQLNPDDVENVTVLKSANAAILYGSAGANGAILITTKKVNTVSQNAYTQQGASGQRTIMGKVIGGEEGNGISGVTVVVKGTSTIALTDRDGNFALKVPNDATLIVFCMGFRTVETPIENKTWYEITLQPEINYD